MRSAILGIGLGCFLILGSPAAAEGLLRDGAAAAGGTAGAMAGGAVGGPIGGALGGVVGGAIGKGAVGVIGAIVPGGKKKSRRGQAEAQAETQAETPPPLLAVQSHAPSPLPPVPSGDVSATALDPVESPEPLEGQEPVEGPETPPLIE